MEPFPARIVQRQASTRLEPWHTTPRTWPQIPRWNPTYKSRKTVYLPTDFDGLFLDQDLTPAEACNRLPDAMVGGGLEVDCHPIINWISVTLNLTTGDDKSPLEIP